MNYSCALAGAVLCLLLFYSGARAEAAPVEFEEKVENLDDWEHLVNKRSDHARVERDLDDTAHIVDFQEYYRDMFDRAEKELKEKEAELRKMVDLQSVTIQGAETHTVEIGLHTKPIRGRYIVMFQSDADDYVLDRTIEILEKANKDSVQRVRATDIHPLRNIGKGFTATLNSKTVNILAKHPLLAHIEEDMAVRRSSISIPAAPGSVNLESNDKAIVWNLDRLDQHDKKLDGEYLPEGTGKNVDIYIIDTGVSATHQELKGRVHYAGFDAVDYLTGTNNHGTDCQGHGTHCAGTAAGKTFGVAKEAEIYNLRALNCQGTGAVSGIVMGIDKIIAHHKENKNGHPAVISQSLGVKKSASLNGAIERAMAAGIVMVGAAGNQADYSCKYSPASAKVGIAVGATNQNDEVTIFSNTGDCTDIMAPGTQIKSASIACDTCTKTMSGTSMAAPHAAGYAAIIFGLRPHLSAYEVKKEMLKRASQGKVMFTTAVEQRAHAAETPNKLLYVPQANAKDSDLVELEDEVSIQSFWSRP